MHLAINSSLIPDRMAVQFILCTQWYIVAVSLYGVTSGTSRAAGPAFSRLGCTNIALSLLRSFSNVRTEDIDREMISQLLQTVFFLLKAIVVVEC